jgi:hypothetical protein
MVNRYTSVSKPLYKHPLPYVFLIIVLIASGASFYWWHKDHTYKKIMINNHKVAVANPNVPGSQTTKGSIPAGGTTGSKDEGDNIPGPAPSSSVQPTTPTGEFVSNHSPNLSGSPAPNTETSVCTTTPGVECQIKFTSGSVVKVLPAQQTDGNGNTLWNSWTLQSIGLTVGNWSITALASNGSKTAIAQDPMQLVIKP